MEDKEVLRAAIELVKGNGWSFWGRRPKPGFYYQVLLNGTEPPSLAVMYDDDLATVFMFEEIIFDHDFAKALFGEKQPTSERDESGNWICLHCGWDIQIQTPRDTGCNHAHHPEACDVCQAKAEDWKYHLERLVLSTDRIDYLRRYLETREDES